MSAPARPAAHGRFRTDVEGLRAVAVLLVICDHLLGKPLGGFIGVDVFFVISGFLISGLLIKEGDRSGRVSIRDFYARRVRRIMPGALLVLTATTAASYLLLSAGRASDTLRDSLWAGGFLANVHFASVGTDYFQDGLPPSAVQHYWSLSVEEQFYVVWPVTLLAVYLVGRRLLHVPARRLVFAIALLTTIVSFAWCIHLTSVAPTDAYFSTAARAWELSTGALLAVAVRHLERVPGIVRTLASWAGLAGIAVASIVITGDTAFPGYAAALPVLSTGLVLAAGNPAGGPGRTFVLANPIVQYVGRLSYSLYLWHWPCIVIAAAYWGPSGFAYWLCAAGVPAVLSVLAFHVVENPIRQSRWLSAKPAGYQRLTVADWYRENKRGLDVALIGSAAMAFLIAGYVDVNRAPEPTATTAAGTAGVQRVSLTEPASTLTGQQRLVAQALTVTKWGHLEPSLDDLRKAPEGCTSVLPSSAERCVYGDAGGSKTAVVIGDSIAMAWTPAVRAALAGHGWRVRMMTLSECPAPDLQTWRNRSTRGKVYRLCADQRRWIRSEIHRLHPDLVVASSLPEFANRIVGLDTPNAAANYQAWHDGTLRLLEAVKADAARTVLISAPPNSGNLQTCVTGRSKPADCVRTLTKNGRAVAAVEARAAKEAGATYVDPVDWFCYEGRCPAVIGTTPVMRDGTHITATYARELAPLLQPYLLGQRK